mgnify:CR=1 FL=1
MKKLQEHIRLMSDERKCVIALILVLFMGLLLVYTYAGDGCRNDHEGILRLHVIANSNKVGDQALKLKVRDAVIEYMADQKDLKTVDETREYLKENKKRLQRIAEGVIAAQGYDYPAAVELGVRYIPQKTYGDITFPAGNYEALNIIIGSGQGENWWCVLFPPLCLLDEGTAPISGDDADSDPAKAAADGARDTGGFGASEAVGSGGNAGAVGGNGSGQTSAQGSGSPGSSAQSDALTKEQKLKLRWKTLELLEGK